MSWDLITREYLGAQDMGSVLSWVRLKEPSSSHWLPSTVATIEGTMYEDLPFTVDLTCSWFHVSTVIRATWGKKVYFILKLTVHQQGRNTRQEFKTREAFCLLTCSSDLLSYFSYTAQAHLPMRRVTQSGPPPSVISQENALTETCSQASLMEAPLPSTDMSSSQACQADSQD